MHPTVWFAITLCVTLLYATRIHALVGAHPKTTADWRVALSLSLGLVVGALLSVRMRVAPGPHVGAGLNAITLFLCLWMGLRYWIVSRRWFVGSGVVAFFLVGLYLNGTISNNIILILVMLGISVGGYYMTVGALGVLCVVFCAFDVYGVWLTNLISDLAGSDSFPTHFLTLKLSRLEIGAADIALSALTVVGMYRHRGLVRAVGLACFCVGSALAINIFADRGFQWAMEVPYMVILTPLVIGFLRVRASACS